MYVDVCFVCSLFRAWRDVFVLFCFMIRIYGGNEGQIFLEAIVWENVKTEKNMKRKHEQIEKNNNLVNIFIFACYENRSKE